MHLVVALIALFAPLALSGCTVVVEQASPQEPAAPAAASTPARTRPKATASESAGGVPADVAAAPRGKKHSDGKASYYADSLAGRKTGSGEPYDPKAFTAAHPLLPFGTWVEVRRPDGRAVRVKINDRGPFGGRGRVIDLSRAAAEKIGMIREGVVDVDIYLLDR